MKAKGIINCTITIVLIALFIHYAGYLVRPLESDSAIDAIDAFHSMQENTLEVIGFGSSHMWRGFDPRVMYDEFGISAYNYGCNWQESNTTSLFVQDAFRTQKPKVVLIEAFYLPSIILNSELDGEIYYTKAIDEFDGKLRYLKQCFVYEWERYLSYYVPLCAFHNNWVNIAKESFAPISTVDQFRESRGFVESSSVTPTRIPDYRTMPQYEFSDVVKTEIEFIIRTCKENGAEIVFYVHPYEGEYHFFDAMERIASENGCVFLNLFALQDEVGLDGTVDFSDPGHLNTSGSQKVARFLGKYLRDHYDLMDHRQNPSA